MNCKEFRRKHPRYALPKSRKISDSPDYGRWVEHLHACERCSDWHQGQAVLKRGFDPKRFPCVHMAYRVTESCDQHGAKCPDILVRRIPKFNEYFIGGSASGFTIRHCPWCGKKLPASKRDRYYSTLEKLGLDYNSKRLPIEFQTDEWYSKK